MSAWKKIDFSGKSIYYMEFIFIIYLFVTLTLLYDQLSVFYSIQCFCLSVCLRFCFGHLLLEPDLIRVRFRSNFPQLVLFSF